MHRLYLIDDHIVMREGLRALLEGAGYAIVGESDAPTPAVADIVRLQPDVVVLDLSLGARSGFEVLQEVQKRKLATRVIVLSMSNQPSHVAQAMRLGAMAYVLKGASSGNLLAAIASVLKGQRYLAEDEADLAVRGLTAIGSSPAAALSAREQQILAMVARGGSSSAIGKLLHLSPKTVDTYRSRLMAKLNLADVPALVRWAIRQGIITADEP